MEKIIVQKLHEIEEKEHGKILLAGQWILESEIAGLREKAGKLGEEKKVSWEKLNEIFLKEIFWRRWCIREEDSLTFALRAVAGATLSFLVPAVNTAISSIPSLLKVTENMVHPGGFEPPTARFVAEYSIQLSYGCIGKLTLLQIF